MSTVNKLSRLPKATELNTLIVIQSPDEFKAQIIKVLSALDKEKRDEFIIQLHRDLKSKGVNPAAIWPTIGVLTSRMEDLSVVEVGQLGRYIQFNLPSMKVVITELLDKYRS